jgi:hypothetical protein
MSMVGTDGTPVVEGSAFADSWKPSSLDSELYREWYAMAWEDYNEALELLQQSAAVEMQVTRDRDNDDLWNGLMQSTVDLMTIQVKDMRAKALDIMRSRHTPETKEIMRGKLLQRVALASITESRGSQLGGALADGVVELRSEE